MPTYLYLCDNCGESIERRLGMHDLRPPIVPCPKCGKFADRDFAGEQATVIPPTKTLGSIADKNDAKFSKDYKRYLKMKNRGRNKKNYDK